MPLMGSERSGTRACVLGQTRCETGSRAGRIYASLASVPGWPRLLGRDRGGKHLLSEPLTGRGIDGCVESAVRPNWMRGTAERGDPFVVAVLVAGIGERVRRAFVAHRGGQLHVGCERQAAVRRAGE